MHVKTMEGLVGARTNMNLLNTPMRVFKEARHKGDTATMERAMGYAGEFAGKAAEYMTKAEEGQKEDAREAREKEKAEREKAIERRREEREKLQTGTEEKKAVKTVAEAREEENVSDGNAVKSETADAVKETSCTGKEAVIYTKTGKADRAEQGSKLSISV